MKNPRSPPQQQQQEEQEEQKSGLAQWAFDKAKNGIKDIMWKSACSRPRWPISDLISANLR